MENAKSQTPLSETLNSKTTTFLGNVIKGVGVSGVTSRDIDFWNSHCELLHQVLGCLHEVPIQHRRSSWLIQLKTTVGGRDRSKTIDTLVRTIAREDQLGLRCDGEVLFKVPFINEIQDISLVLATPRALGFDKETAQGLIFEKAMDEGLSLCPPEVALYLFLNHPFFFQVQDGTVTVIASEPVYADLNRRDPRIFWIIISDDSEGYKRILSAENGHGSFHLPPDYLIAFAVEE